ncbi:phosphoserine aminotransferase [Philodulcilactobacillus myokoensis]|uniref:Phosphoserine aminotransferase n=1 Tax=Philodulcilactobacillus myokoensis TaxID=2929573 RepID=A0A9W6B1Y3_9LACO|nr:3-phosphoserine/phosphohydroxythreonine transaminase [Philodulcilactobacillus myokoensis]GLB47449.1 phosphoserine aminotransferase [Philodulcilactobacillus myokoensis]
MSTVYNFSAGPGVLPAPVIKQIQKELTSFHGSGMSILEISHRSTLFENVIDNAKQDLKDLMQVPDNYQILFFQGGGTGQFAAAPMNLASKHHRLALLDSGHWASKAHDEAIKLGYQVDVLDSTKSEHYHELPHLSLTFNQKNDDYLHVTINNTIEGTTYHQINNPTHLPLVGDMSSNFLAERYSVKDFGMIFAGAQKNLGPAGVTIVIVRDDLLKKVPKIPSILDYSLFAKKNSLYNTPPVFSIYAAGLVLKWLKKQGGVDVMESHNRKQSKMMYDFLDQSKLFRNDVKPSDRSLTNTIFTTGDQKLDLQVAKEATQHGLMSIKGHRSVGGLRASFYNAMPTAGVQSLIDFLHDFEKKH